MTSERAATKAKRRHSDELMSIVGVYAVGTERDDTGNWSVVVDFDPETVAIDDLPIELDGVPVRHVTRGPFFGGPARRYPDGHETSWGPSS